MLIQFGGLDDLEAISVGSGKSLRVQLLPLPVVFLSDCQEERAFINMHRISTDC